MQTTIRKACRASTVAAVTTLAAALSIGLAGASEAGNYFAPMASYVFADDERGTDDAYGGALAIGRRLTPYMGVELRASYLDYGDVKEGLSFACENFGNNCPDDIELYGGGVGLNLYPFRGHLYVHAEALAGNHAHFSGGLGYAFGNVFGGLSVVIEALYQSADGVDEPRLNAGLLLPFGRESKAARPAPMPTPEPASLPEPPPEPVRVVEAPCAVSGPGKVVELSGCEVGDTILLEGVYFAIDSTKLNDTASQTLDRVAAALTERDDLKVEVRGHTDSTASDAYNLRLSLRRAEAIRDDLVDAGIDAARLSVEGLGESQPAASNDTEKGRARNRRAELHVLKADPDATADGATPSSQQDPAMVPDGLGSTVRIHNFAFEPPMITVSKGTRVMWTNAGSSDHTVKFMDRESFRIPPGESFSRTFDTAGEYEYRCGIHPSMTGTIRVAR